MKKINFKVILGLIVTTLLLSACGKGGGLYDDSGQTYRVATSDMNTLDTVLATLILSACSNKSLYSDEGQVFREVSLKPIFIMAIGISFKTHRLLFGQIYSSLISS